MAKTPIEWSDYTFNPVWGYTKVSPGCKGCYAEAFDKRLGGKHWGPGSARRQFGEKHWAQPLIWNAKAKRDGRIYRVFCASMADWLEDHPDWIEPRARLEALVAATPNLIWLFLTKRPENWRLMPEAWRSRWPSNAMFGFTAENNEYLEKRWVHWDDFVTTSLGVNTFISAEPLLGPLEFMGDFAFVHWVICGGESGHGARPMHPDWARSLRDQCAAAGVPFLFKQWGEWAYSATKPGEMVWNGNHGMNMIRVGKHKAGRILDGVEHNGLPLYWPSNVGLLAKEELVVIP